MDMIFRPIEIWPVRMHTNRKRAKFRVGYNKTLADLDRELRHLKARNVVIQLALSQDEIRLDGVPRSSASPRHPGVVLSFDSKSGPLSFPCDTYDDWQDNLRAISLALSALRSVDRYGVTRSAEQYRGWKALPPAEKTQAAMTRSAALLLVHEKSGRMPVSTDEELRAAYRQAAMNTHPDRNSGDVGPFKKLQDAKAALGL